MHRHALFLLAPLAAAIALTVAVGAASVASATPSGGRLAGEWDPGYSARDLGGELTVDDYGVGGLGAYPLQLGDGSIVSAVCVQADVGHSLTVEYRQDASPSVESAELAYLLWRYLQPGHVAPSDDIAAAINVLAWRYADAQRRGGGAVWQGEDVDIVVSGGGHLGVVEQTVDALRAEAAQRRGPWTLTADPPTSNGDEVDVAARLAGPGGLIAGELVTFRAGEATIEATTSDDGIATARFTPRPSGPVTADAAAPGSIVTWSAPGSQRVAVAGPPAELTTAVDIPPPPTTSTTTVPPTVAPTTSTTTVPPTAVPPTTSTTTSTTVAPTAVPPSTVSPTTSMPTTSTTNLATSTTAPHHPVTTTSVSPPPTLPRTGSAARPVARWGALLFALGALGLLGATAGFSPDGRGDGERRRRSSG